MSPASARVRRVETRPRQATHTDSNATPTHSSNDRRGIQTTPKPGSRFSKVSKVLSSRNARPKRQPQPHHARHGGVDGASGQAFGGSPKAAVTGAPPRIR